MRTSRRLAVTALLVLAAACGGDDEPDASVVIVAEDAPAYVSAVLPALADLPGDGWTLTARQETAAGTPSTAAAGDEVDEFDRALQTEPACADFAELDSLSSIFGGDDVDPLAGGEAEYEQLLDDELISASIQVDVEVHESETITRQQFNTITEFAESGSLGRCFEAAFSAGFTELDPSMEVTFASREPVATAPQGGTGFAFDFGVEVAGLSIDTVMEVQFWPNANSGIAVVSIVPTGKATPGYLQSVLDLIDANAQAAIS